MDQMSQTTVDKEAVKMDILKLTPTENDIFVFFVETDDNGLPLIDLDVISETANYIQDILNGAKAIFMFDKFTISAYNSEENIRKGINGLEKVLSAFSEAAEKVGDIQSGKEGEDLAVIRVKDIMDGNERGE